MARFDTSFKWLADGNPPPEPTFYLGGQPYVFEKEELLKAGPELAETALYETYRQMWRAWSDRFTGRLCREEWERRQTELCLGLGALRDIIPTKEMLIPNGHFVRIH